MSAPDGYTFVCRYRYLDKDGKCAGGKDRYELEDWMTGRRSKTFRYIGPDGSLGKPFGFDLLIYHLPEVLAAIRAGRTIHWTEGEKDADALTLAGAVATSHHQGAGKVTQAQANWLTGARSVWVWMDRDTGHAEVGAYDAALRHNLIVRAGVDADRIRIVRSRSGKDAYDHLAAGFKPGQAVGLNKAWVAATARRFTPTVARKLGYRHARG